MVPRGTSPIFLLFFKALSGKEIVSIMKHIVKKILSAWSYVGILIRGDSHYGTPEIYDFCKENELKYSFGLTPQSPMREKTEDLRDEAKKLYTLHQETVRLFSEFQY